jgi:CSLREA domain-containing protein
MLRRISLFIALAALFAGAVNVTTATTSATLRLNVPATASTATSVAVTFNLPAGIAAVEGRLLLDKSAAEVVGLAPVGGGVALTPVEIPTGYAFGAYGMSQKSKTTIRIIVAPEVQGALQLSVVVDAASDAAGHRVNLVANAGSTQLHVGKGKKYGAPPKTQKPGPTKGAGPTRDIVADGALGKMDLDVVKSAWDFSHMNSVACGTGDLSADANSDGCIDIVDIQAVYAAQGQAVAGAHTYRTGVTVAAARAVCHKLAQAASTTSTNPAQALDMSGTQVALNQTFVVTSTADTPDAANGDGICADAAGQCTLRAAVTESNWAYGPNRIEFNLLGTAPVAIRITNGSMQIQDRTGGTTIDGYTQPGSSVNSATVGSNARPGVLLIGTNDTPRTYAFRITSSFNTVRGLQLNSFYRPLFLDTADSHDNLIVGNILGFNADGSVAGYTAYDGIQLNTGANHNQIGSAALADRNVSGRAQKAVYLYGPGTEYNVIQNTVMCITPSGFTDARCLMGVDFDFGAKHNTVGGLNPGELNVVGPTDRQAIEISHGWDPSGAPDPNGVWQLNDNHIVGNWLGFRGDGSYDPSFRSGLVNPGGGDNGNGVNIHDGCNYNVVESNYVASMYDGIQMMAANATGNIIRNNVVGQSPLGQAAPLTRDGIVARENMKGGLIEGNTVRNAGRYGIGITNWNVFFVKVTRNIVTDMSGPAIFFMADPSDASRGADDLLARPVISSATTTTITGTGIAGATVEVYKADRGAGQSGLPVAYLGAATVASNGTWSLPSTLALGDRATALQFIANGNTSALGLNVTVTSTQQTNPPVASFTQSQVAGTLEMGFTDTSTQSPTSWNWSFGDGIRSTAQNPSHTYAAGGDYQVTLTASNGSGSNSTTRTVTVQTPVADAIAASDDFGRVISNGWGSAVTGGSYTIVGTASNFSVDGSAGVMTLPAKGASRSALLNSVSQSNQDIRLRVSADKAPTDGKFFVYAVGRLNGNNEYRPRVIFNADGTLSANASQVVNGSESALGKPVVVPGITFTAGQFIWLRAQISGTNPTTVRVKVWADGQAEPNGWIFTATNSSANLQRAGATGVRAYMDLSTTQGAVNFRIDDFQVTSTASSTTVATDSFSRSKTSTWGGADIGGLYSIVGNAANFNVNGSVGTIDLPGAGASRSVLLNDVNQQNIDIRFRVAIDKLPVGANVTIYAVARRNNNNEYRPRITIAPNGTVSVSASVVNGGAESPLAGAIVVPGLTAAPGSFIWIHATVTGANPTTIRVKAWADGQAEPGSWQFTATNSLAALQGAGRLGLRTYVTNGLSNGALRLSFDDYSVTTSL